MESDESQGTDRRKGVASLQILYKLKNVQQENSMLKRQSELFRAGIII